MPHEPIPPDLGLNALEAALGSLAPAPSMLDRDRTMFLAGRASALAEGAEASPSRGRHAWARIAACLAVVASGEAVLLARPPAERVVVIREPAPTPAPAAASPTPALVDAGEAGSPSTPAGDPFRPGQTPRDRLAWQVLRYGLDGLPASPAGARDPSMPVDALSHPRELLREELRNLLNPGGPS